MGRLFSIADIHGRYDLLRKLLNLLWKRHDLDLRKDKLIFTGDYVDRGSDSFCVLKELYDLNSLYPDNVVCLLGNHEQMMVDWHEGDDKWGLWIINGGDATLESFNQEGYEECPDYLLEWVKNLPILHQERGFFFSHAPLAQDDGRVLTKDDYIWTYWRGDESIARTHSGGVIGVCGHLHALNKGLFEPRFYDHYIFGDAGCGCHPKAPLCAINVETRQAVYATP